jgi:acetyltransferase-like isoleucine patch superfamily enzyme
MPASITRRLIDAPLNRLAVALGVRIERRRAAISRAALPTFATDAPGLVLDPPYELRHPRRISFGHNVRLGPNCVLKLTTRYPGPWMAHQDGNHVEQTFDPHLIIGDRVTATSALQVTVYARVTIEDDVLFASNVYLSDGSHAIARGDRPYKYQGIERVAPVHIGRGAWIGQNAVILPGVTIGAFAVIGANAVVTTDIPSGAIAVGAPARVIRRWDTTRERWVRANEDHPHERPANQSAGGARS